MVARENNDGARCGVRPTNISAQKNRSQRCVRAGVEVSCCTTVLCVFVLVCQIYGTPVGMWEEDITLETVMSILLRAFHNWVACNDHFVKFEFISLLLGPQFGCCGSVRPAIEVKVPCLSSRMRSLTCRDSFMSNDYEFMLVSGGFKMDGSHASLAEQVARFESQPDPHQDGSCQDNLILESESPCDGNLLRMDRSPILGGGATFYAVSGSAVSRQW
jgi:hypothetical protein